MPSAVLKKEDQNKVAVVKKIRDYGNDPAFKKKAEKAAAFIKKNGLPSTSSKKNK